MDRKPTQSAIVGCLALLVVTLALYSPVTKHPFINFDDQPYVVKNLHVTAGLTWSTFTWSWTSMEQSNWHPLTWLSHALDCDLYGLNAGGHHFTSVLLHGFNAVLLFLLLRQFTGSVGRSLLVAALFALHPLNVESVAWVAERKNILSTLFFLLTIGAYGWYARKPGLPHYLAVAALFVLGLASKPMVITLPFVLLLLDYWPLQRIAGWSPAPAPQAPDRRARKNRSGPSSDSHATGFSVPQAPCLRLVMEKLPLLLFCAGSALITILAQRTVALRTLETFPLGVRLENAACAYAMYIWKAFWPARLALYYPYPRTFLPAWQVGGALLFLAAVSALVWKYRSTRRYLVTGWLWYLGTLVPVIGLVQVGDQAMADRYAYIPMLGIFVMAVWSAADWADHRRIIFPWRAAVAAAVLGSLSFLTWRQIGYWRSSYDLWTHTLAVTENNPLAESDLAGALHELGRFEEALPHYQKAVRLTPQNPTRRADLAEDLAECGLLPESVEQYQYAIQFSADSELQSRSYESLAILHAELGDYVAARDSYRGAVKINPGLEQEMIGNARQFVAGSPSGGTYLYLGMLLQESGQLEAAHDAYQQALKLNPSLASQKQFLEPE